MAQRIVIFLLVVLSASFAPGKAQTPSTTAPSHPFVMGTELEYPPYSFRDDNGNPAGYNVDLVRAVARAAGLDIRITIGPWNEIRRALETGNLDAICGMYYSPERKKQVHFTLPFTIIHHAVFARKGTPKITSEKELRGKKLIVMRDDIMHDYVREQGLCEKPILAATQAEALERLAAGEGQYALVAQLPGLYWTRTRKLDNLVITGPLLAPRKYCFAVGKDNFELRSRLDEGLAVITESGEHRDIYDKWFKTLEETSPGQRFVLRHVLVVVLPLLGLLIVAVAWLWTVRRQVHRATAELRNEIAERRRAEEDIQGQRDFFRIVLDTVPAFICVKKIDGKYALTNKALCKAYGTTIAGLEGHRDAEFSPLPEEVEQFLEDDRRVIQDKTTRYIPQEKITYADGSTHWLSTIKTPLLEKDGSCDRLLAVAMDITKRVQAMEELRELNVELEQRVARRTEELESRVKEVEQLNTAMVNLSDDLRKTNRNLKRTTAGLQAANRELETFSYSVSHDLRAPLRAMDGFSQAVLEDYGEKLDDAGRDYLQRIRAAAQHMGNLIDAILELSRVGRTEMVSGEVNLSALAEQIVSELQPLDPDRRVQFAIAPNLTCRGDAKMLQQVLANLLENAWKFTAPREEARIELTTLRDEQASTIGRAGQTVYVVRDNGVGFDMHYASKLFGAFQRLHNREEFPGTGVGLATVQRILHRHGGEVWAEGAVDQGASIYFTIGE